jgi:hypothetical protein
MWQRIQTVFLVLAIASLGLAIFFPIWTYPAEGVIHKLFAFHYSTFDENGQAIAIHYFPYSTTAILIVAAITVSVIEIGKYRDRVLQMKLGALNSLILAGIIGAAFIFSNQLADEFKGGQIQLGMWLPGVAVLCNLLANRFIRRDEKLVRDSQRLR